jgi:hypothetical protein
MRSRLQMKRLPVKITSSSTRKAAEDPLTDPYFRTAGGSF